MKRPRSVCVCVVVLPAGWMVGGMVEREKKKREKKKRKRKEKKTQMVQFSQVK